MKATSSTVFDIKLKVETLKKLLRASIALKLEVIDNISKVTNSQSIVYYIIKR